jgi:hypothetical protein
MFTTNIDLYRRCSVNGVLVRHTCSILCWIAPVSTVQVPWTSTSDTQPPPSGFGLGDGRQTRLLFWPLVQRPEQHSIPLTQESSTCFRVQSVGEAVGEAVGRKDGEALGAKDSVGDTEGSLEGVALGFF